jgi:hypothetical protein
VECKNRVKCTAVDLTESDRSSGCNCGLNTLQTELLKILKADEVSEVSANCPFYASFRENKKKHSLCRLYVCLSRSLSPSKRVNVKISLEQSIKTQHGSTGIALLSL